MAHGSLILVDKTERRDRRTSIHDVRGIQSLPSFWGIRCRPLILFCKAYKLERFSFSVMSRERIFLTESRRPYRIYHLRHTGFFSNRELLKIQEHCRGGGLVDVTPGEGEKYEGRVNNSSSLPNTHAVGSQNGRERSGQAPGKQQM